MVPEGIKFAFFCKSGLPRVEKRANFMSKGAISKNCAKSTMSYFSLDTVFFVGPNFSPLQKLKHLFVKNILCLVFMN